MRDSGGFTLIELVVAMTLSAIVIGFVALFMTAPVGAYIDQSERTVLNTSAEVISRRLTADLQTAIPNSVRIRNAGTRAIVEMMQYDAVALYIAPSVVAPDPVRDLNATILETQFSVLGYLTSVRPVPAPAYPVGRLVVGNTGSAPTNIYQPAANRFMTPAGANVRVIARTGTNEETVSLPGAGFRFDSTDNTNRIFVLRGPVAYICNSAARTLRRYEQYTAAAAAPASEAAGQLNAAGVLNEVLVNNISSCRLSCGVGPSSCPTMLVVEMSVNRPAPAANEGVRIFEQFPMDNRS